MELFGESNSDRSPEQDLLFRMIPANSLEL
jgi:hypothetical protein